MKRPCFAALGLGVALLGCPASTSYSSLYTPITGIRIDSAQLVYGLGCGTGTGQVYQYAAVVSFALDGGLDAIADTGPPSVLGTSGVFDCFADGVLGNLPASDSGSFSYNIQIFAYDQASFPSALACPPGTGGPTGQTCPGDVAANVIPFESVATFTAVCTATQVTGVTVPALCRPLVAARGTGVDAGAVLDASTIGDATGEADAVVDAPSD